MCCVLRWSKRSCNFFAFRTKNRRTSIESTQFISQDRRRESVIEKSYFLRTLQPLPQIDSALHPTLQSKKRFRRVEGHRLQRRREGKLLNKVRC